MSESKSKSVNIYDGLCNFIESFHYIQTVDLYDGDDELIYSAKELRDHFFWCRFLINEYTKKN